uniref:Uncharacterized protein n=1 Tax=Kalanchoe fedtschenkoi TaxID=63787 RepID=A0A7N0V3N5_KALFE
MAESIITALLWKVDSLIQEEAQHLQSAHTNFRDMKDELRSIQAFLRQADANEEIHVELDNWVKQVRDVAFELEDVLDEYMRQLEPQSDERICGFPFPNFQRIQNLNDLHEIASKMKEIMSKFEKIPARLQRYGFEAKSLLQAPNSKALNREKYYNPQDDALLLDDEDLVGVETPKNKLIEWLLTGDSAETIPVVGMGGLGKTCLVKKVYDDAAVKKRFEIHAWITVSKTFKIDALWKKLIRQLYQESLQPGLDDLEKMDSLEMKQKVNALLKSYRYVIVIDDVWSTDAWKSIQGAFPRKSGSRVIVTTRNKDVASISCTFEDHIYNMKPLSDEESSTLFNNRTFRRGPCPSHLADVSGRILKKCAGLPLAIVAISGVLMTKDRDVGSDEWDKIDRSLRAELKDNEMLRGINCILSLSYHDLPYYLKPCFLYTSLFHEDHPITCNKLIRLWLAEGFVQKKAGNTPEEVAESYLTELLKKSLIHVEERTSDGRMKTFRIHDLMREIIISKSHDQNFAAVSKENGGPRSEKVRRLSVHNTIENVQNDQNLHQLRSLLVFGVEEPLSKRYMPTLFSGGIKLLTVLDLQGTTNLKNFPTIITKLLSLRYLSLRNTKVRKIPGSIGMLQKLETLDLKRTLVSKLPTEILNLHSLRNLLVYHCELETDTAFNTKHGFKASNGIASLKSIQKLCFVKAGKTCSAVVREVRMLTELRRLGIIDLSTQNGTELCTSISKLKHLRALSVTSSKNEKLDLQHLAHPPISLQRLYLTGQLASLPPWIQSLQRLVKIFLKSSKLLEDPLTVLECLPNLVHIEFLQVYEGSELRFKKGNFQKLKILGLHEFDALRRVIIEEGSMPNLETLIMENCGDLKTIPSGIENPSKLTLLDFVNMPNELMTTIRRIPAEGPEHVRTKHITEVNWIYLKDGKWQIERLSSTVTNRQQDSHMKKTVWGIDNFRGK